MDPFTLAQIAAAAISFFGQRQAAANQQRAAVEAQQRALASQNQATDVAMKHVQEYAPEKRKAAQDEIQTQLADKYQQAATPAPITAQGVQVGQTIPGGTTDYLAAKGREVAKAAESNRNLASLLSRIGSAGQLRRNEGVAFGDTAGQIGRIAEGADNMGEIDQKVGIPAAGQQGIGSMLASTVLGAYGKAGATTRGLFGQPSDYTLSTTALGPNTSAGMGLGMKLGGGLGMKSTGNWLLPQG